MFLRHTVSLVILFATSAYGQAPAAPASNIESEVSAGKAENAAVKEQLKTMEEQQKALQETVDRLQRGLGGPAPAASAGQPAQPGITEPTERYQDGIVLWRTKDTDKIPFLVKYNQDI